MAHVLPEYSSKQESIVSAAERKFYDACVTLSDQYHIFHSVGWITRTDGGAADGEADFLICHPERGFVIVEIKGGRIEANYSAGTWYSTDRRGNRHPIKDPFRQGTKAKYGILGKLKEQRDWERAGIGRVVVGHAAFFPDVGDGKRLQGPDAPQSIIGDAGDLGRLEQWIEGVFDYWSGKEDRSGAKLGSAGISIITRVFARSVRARPLLSVELASNEKRRLELTERQIRTLDVLSRLRRVSISGGAGTGKTVLAVEKARRLAREGFRTLLTCYNTPLARHLTTVCADEPGLEVISFHKLCKEVIDAAGQETGRDFIAEAKATYPGLGLWDQYFPISLTYALEVFERRYDAIVIDEGQDFGEEFWLPIETLLADSKTSPLYVFHDENQNIYRRVSSFPVDAAPAMLTVNCRNTRSIHELAYRFYAGEAVNPSDIEGQAVDTLEAQQPADQSRLILHYVSRLIVDEKVSPHNIVILIAENRSRDFYHALLAKLKLPGGARWGGIEGHGPNVVAIETVARFKGLESEVLVLWGLEESTVSGRQEAIYVGASRAKSVLAVCGSADTCKAILSG